MVLSNEDGTVYAPGSLVSGVVKLLCSTDEPFGSVAITFTGCCKVILSHSRGDMSAPRSEQKSCACIFRRYLNLQRGPQMYGKGTYMWPFAFQLPNSADSHLDGETGSGEIFDHRPPWQGSDSLCPHPLPPTMNYSGDFKCSVEYELQARVIRPPRSVAAYSSIIAFTKHIEVGNPWKQIDSEMEDHCPFSEYYHTFSTRNSHTNESVTGRVLSVFRESAHKSAQTGLRRRFDCRIRVLVPKSLEVKQGSPISVFVSASCVGLTENDADVNSTDTTLPSGNIVVKNCALSMSVRTMARVGSQHSSELRKIALGNGGCEIPVQRSPKKEDSIFPSTSEALAESRNEVEIPNLKIPNTRLVPSFSTYNIYRSHTLELRFDLEYAGKRVKFTLRDIPIKLVPDRTRTVETSARVLGESDIPPPPLDEVTEIEEPPDYSP